MVLEESFQKIRIKGVGADDEVGLYALQSFVQGVFRRLKKGERFGEVLAVGGLIDPTPDTGGVGNDEVISPFENAICARAAEVAGIADPNVGSVLQGFTKISCC